MTGAPVVKTLHAPSQDSSVVVDEATKLQLAMRVSQVAMVPGAVTLNGINQLSYGQKEEISNLRHIQKSRAAYRDDSSSIQPPTTLSAINEEDPLDVLQTRMNEFQNVESRNIEIDDAVQRKQTKRSCGMIAVLVVLAVAVVAGVVAVIVIVVTLGSRNQEGIHDTLADDEREEDDDIKATMKGFNECFMGNTTLASHPQHGLLTTAAFRVLPSIEGDLNTTGSSQRAAFCWLSEVDSYVLVQPNEALIPYELVQRFALATIFFHFNGTLNDDSSNLVELNWLMHVHVCWWPSVACNGLGNEVTDLHLDTLPLNTVIPKELALLSNLTDLKLTACGLRGRIPSELSNLSHLEHVAMDGNELTGEITLNFTNMPQLMLLDLTNNYLSGEIPPQFYEIPNLQVANLGWNKFTGTLVASGLSNATGLTRFAVDYNQLTGNIPDISRLTKMEFLGMSYNQLHGTFPDVSRMTNLSKNMKTTVHYVSKLACSCFLSLDTSQYFWIWRLLTLRGRLSLFSGFSRN